MIYERDLLKDIEKLQNRTHLINFDVDKKIIDIQSLEKVLNTISNQIYQKFDSETARLFSRKQYNLALITGYISFEKSIREHYKNNRFTQTRLFSMLLDDKIINQEQVSVLEEARHLRNKIIHGDDNIKLTKDQVTTFLETLKFVQNKIAEKK